MQFIDTPPPLFVLPTLRVCRTTVGFFLYRIDLFLYEFG